MKMSPTSLALVALAAICAVVHGADEALPTPAGPALTAVAGEPGGESLSPELKEILRRLDDANAALKDLSASVIYERAIPLLEEKQKCKGTLIYKKPDRIALKLGPPRNEEVYTDGRYWWVVSKDDKQVEIYEASTTGVEATEAAFLDFGYGKGSDKLLQQYRVEIVSRQNSGEGPSAATLYRLKFTARANAQRAARYNVIEAEISSSRWLPHLLVLHESGGEIVHTYVLQEVRLNAGVRDDVFEYKPPRGYTILHPQQF